MINYLKKYLSKEDKKELSGCISDIEKRTSGEIRLCVKYKKEWHERKYSARELALKEFHKLEMQNTKLRTGVLLLILFKDRKFEIVADEGINSRVEQKIWEDIASEMSNRFSVSNFKEGIIFTLKAIGNLMEKEFPPVKDDTDELPNEVIFK